MLSNKKVNMVIALIVAIVLWAYVIGDLNPATTETVRGIPITFIHEDSLKDAGLVILDISTESVNISFSGPRSSTSKAKASDFKVVADLGEVEYGENRIKLTVSGPENVEITDVSTQRISVNVDELITAEKPVNVTLVNQESDETEPYIVQVSKEKISVTGAKSLVDSVVSLEAPVDASKVGNQMKALSVGLIPENEQGEQVSGVTLSDSNVSVTAVLLNKKTVTLNVPVIGENSENVERQVSVPKTITIKGMDMVLSGITAIDCESLDVSDVYENQTIQLKPILPEGVEITLDSQELCANVTVENIQTRTFQFTEKDIIMEGVDEDIPPVISPVEIKVTVVGKEEIISKLTEEDFDLTVDVSELQNGTYNREFVCKCNEDIAKMEYSPKTIEIIIE